MAKGAAAHRALDPVLLEIVWHRLIAVADEAATTLVRTSFSPIVRESNDFSCVLYDVRGNAIVENTIGIPSFNMTLGRTLRHVLRRRPPDRWRPGDIVFTNDPWIGAGHLPDITIVAPIYLDDRLLGWVGSIAHHVDVGGTGWSADASDVFEEGVRIPPLLLMREGELNEDVVELISANVRLPDRLLGDLLAQVWAGEVAGERLRELVRDAELTDLESVSDQIGQHNGSSRPEHEPDGVEQIALRVQEHVPPARDRWLNAETDEIK